MDQERVQVVRVGGSQDQFIGAWVVLGINVVCKKSSIAVILKAYICTLI